MQGLQKHQRIQTSSGLQHAPASTVRAATRVVAGTRRVHLAAAAGRQDGLSISTPSMASQACAAVLAATLMCSQPAFAIDESTVTSAVAEYVDLDSKGKLKTSAEVDKLRQKYRLRRAADGRLQLRSSRGEWFQVRLDMEVPGSMLLRDPKGGVFAIQTEALQQIDLSDDLVALLMFSDGEWEKQMAPVEYMDEDGTTKQLQLDEREFREVIGLLKEIGDEQEGQPRKK
mmetsp:Transcript_6402/g.10957  ORF Transcript_6402/g.10957 Transcript_6402/m.10957 type:complete len:229 (-) Transcript_6402:385-1071(-)|eukprot:CAMPEP_0119108382 /NCGR_PEP_ID=MMETSP1180-20130426/14066_1 /TAXON_ID=3052 ORGANISM="Chlamydomonas cf sp, Strain CCMP681" /NCGR_SAMPLE_ID=MMETSP1180 /ASSEMBLY_ACC=CAM_ASM_000741 /LENGTH=228 /DNA_ID=CAMNT_0007093989 /DNA_START=48 /DNA_END=734 /DNA_ORIENTATION=+